MPKVYRNQLKLFTILKKQFPTEIKYEFTPKWLGRQRFDMYFLNYNIAVEYNGKQHYTPVRRFGGKIGLKRTLERDARKRLKCIENNCVLLELKYDYTQLQLDELIKIIGDIITQKEKEITHV